MRFDTLSAPPLGARLDLKNRMLKQVYLKEMPPPKKRSQPSVEERKPLSKAPLGVNPIKHFCDFDPALKGDQPGPIKRFLT